MSDNAIIKDLLDGVPKRHIMRQYHISWRRVQQILSDQAKIPPKEKPKSAAVNRMLDEVADAIDVAVTQPKVTPRLVHGRQAFNLDWLQASHVKLGILGQICNVQILNIPVLLRALLRPCFRSSFEGYSGDCGVLGV